MPLPSHPNPFLSDADFEAWFADQVRPRRLLLIDDDDFMHDAIGQTTGGYNVELTSAFDGPTGVEKFMANKPDVVWLDYKLSGMDGVDVFQAIRNYERKVAPGETPVPAIFVSGYLDTSMIERIYKVGIAFLLRKPDHINDATLQEVFRSLHISKRR
jgi:CheY-like chemotaxis protein